MVHKSAWAILSLDNNRYLYASVIHLLRGIFEFLYYLALDGWNLPESLIRSWVNFCECVSVNGKELKIFLLYWDIVILIFWICECILLCDCFFPVDRRKGSTAVTYDDVANRWFYSVEVEIYFKKLKQYEDLTMQQ